jgi:toxin ParE1/3/4
MPTKIYWTRQSREDLRAIRDFIARDAPKTAAAYVRRLRHSVERLRQLPHSGQVVPELQREELREVLQGNYRIIYRVGDRRVDVLTVYHAARLLDESNFEN